MANPREFKVGDELYRTAFGSVSTAQLADDSAPSAGSQNFAIKIYDPAGFEANAEGAANFLKSVEAQQQASASGKNWAPIHASGTNADGKSFYVTNYYPRSAQRLISGKVSLTADALHEIVRAILSGLLDMRQSGGRSHGNIKPSNILIGGRGAVADAKIALTDPAPGPCADANAEAEDLRAVGALIYHLIMHRTFHTTSWPLADGEQWKHLGRGNRQWREFCNTLLNPDAQARPSLVDANRVVKSLAVRKLVTRGRLKLAAAAVVVGAVLAGAGWGVLQWENKVKADVGDISAQWLKPLDARPELASDPVYTVCVKKDKAAFDESIDAFLADDASLRPAAIQNFLQARSAAPACRKAWIDAVAFDRLDVSGKIEALRKNGWTLPTVPASPENPTTAIEVTNCAGQLIKLRTKLSDQEPTRAWEAFETHLQPIRSPDFYDGFALYLEKEAAKSIALSNDSWKIDQRLLDKSALMADRLRKTKERPVILDFERMKRDEKRYDFDKPSYAEFAWFVASPNPNTPGALSSNADIYEIIPVLAKNEVERLRGRLATEIDAGMKAHPTATPPASSDSERNSIENAINTLEKGPYVKKDDVDGVVPTLSIPIDRKIDVLVNKWKVAWISDAPPPDLVDLTAFVVATIDPILLKGDLLAIKDEQARKLKNAKFPPAVAEQNKAKIIALCDALTKINSFPDAPMGMSKPYDGIITQRHDEVWGDLLGPLKKSPDSASTLSVADARMLAEQADKASSEYKAWCGSAKTLAGDFGGIAGNHIIDLATFPAGAWENASDPGQKAFWQTEVRGEKGKFFAALKPFLDRYDRLLTVRQNAVENVAKIPEADLQNVAGAEVFITAWQKLVADKKFPSPGLLSIAGLGDEAPIRRKLAVVSNAIGKKGLADPQLAAQVKAAVDAGPGRWCEAFKSAKTSPEIAKAMLARTDFAVDDAALRSREAELQPAGYYNAVLWLTITSLGKQDDLAATACVKDLTAATAKLPQCKAMNDWLKAQPYSAKILSAVLDDSFYFPQTQPDFFIVKVLTASEQLMKDKSPDLALALSMTVYANQSAAMAASEAWGKNFFNLANVFAAGDPLKIRALMYAMRLGNADATTAMIDLDPKIAVAELKPLRSNLDSATLVRLAQIYEKGSADKQVPKSDTDAHDLYALAADKDEKDKKVGTVAMKWIAKYKDEALASLMPTAPVGVDPQPLKDGGIELKWNAVTNVPGVTYKVYRAKFASGPWETPLSNLPITESRYPDTDAPPGVESFYKIAAVNQRGKTGPMSTLASAWAVPPVVSGVGAKAIDEGGGIMLTWDPLPNVPADAYVISISRSDTGKDPWTELPVKWLTKDGVYRDADAPVGVPTYYQIVAGNKSGHGKPGSPLPPATARPPAITGLTATPADDGSITVRWTSIGVEAADGYNVYRSPTNKDLSWTNLTDKPTKVSEFIDSPAPAGLNYYKVEAIKHDTKGKFDTKFATAAKKEKFVVRPHVDPSPSNKPDPEKPPATLLAPATLTADDNDDGITLTWSLVEHADHYIIWRDDKQLPGPIKGPTHTDRRPPKGSHKYRIYPVGEDGQQGKSYAEQTAKYSPPQ